jgi:peptidoglycan/LPS O-acetylase OafA/YrhL
MKPLLTILGLIALAVFLSLVGLLAWAADDEVRSFPWSVFMEVAAGIALLLGLICWKQAGKALRVIVGLMAVAVFLVPVGMLFYCIPHWEDAVVMIGVPGILFVVAFVLWIAANAEHDPGPIQVEIVRRRRRS